MATDILTGTRSSHLRARVTVYALAAVMLMNIAGIWAGIAQHSLLAAADSGATLAPGQAEANDVRYAGVGLLQVVLFLATAVAWLMWQHRAYANLRLVGTGDTEFAPGWTVGYWFIPIMNLFRPYQVTAELWRRSELQNARDPLGALGQTRPGLVGVWWGLYLFMGLMGNVSSRALNGAQTFSDSIVATDLGISADVVSIVSGGLAIVVVKTIDRYQQAFDQNTRPAGP